MSSKKLNPFKDFHSDQIQRSSHKIFTAHYACRNAALNLTPVTGMTNGFIFQIINSQIESWGVRLTWFDCKFVIWKVPCLMDWPESSLMWCLWNFCLQCPPCRAFTPKLIESYKKIVSKGKPFEIIFVSSDRAQEGFDDYFKDMPWLALPYGEDKIKKEISTRFSVQGKNQVVMN